MTAKTMTMREANQIAQARIAELEKENEQLRDLGDELAYILRQIFSGEVTEEDAHIVEGEGLAAIKAWEDAKLQ